MGTPLEPTEIPSWTVGTPLELTEIPTVSDPEPAEPTPATPTASETPGSDRSANPDHSGAGGIHVIITIIPAAREEEIQQVVHTSIALD